MESPTHIRKKHIISLLIGNILEHYDTALFGLLSPVLAPLFFPNDDPLISLILTYMLIPLGMLAKPFGALFFGFISDHVGRKESLILSLLGMSVATCGFALIPTYQDIGSTAALLLAFLRIMQAFFASGENVSGAIFMLENAADRNHTFLSSLWDTSVVGGILLASLAVTSISLLKSIEDLWRVLYFAGGSTALIALFLRFYLPHSIEVKKDKKIYFTETFKTLVTYRKEIIMIAFAAGFSYASYSIALVFMNAFIPLVSSSSYAESIHLNSVLLVFDLLLLPFVGFISSYLQIQREKLMFFSALGAFLLSPLLFMLLGEATFLLIVPIRVLFVIIGVCFSASFFAWCQQIAPKNHRGIVISFGYSLGTQAFGGPTVALSLFIFRKTGSLVLTSGYFATLALICLLLFSKTLLKKREIVPV